MSNCGSLFSRCLRLSPISTTIRQLYNTSVQRVEVAPLLRWRWGARSEGDGVDAKIEGAEAADELSRQEKFIPVTRRSLIRRLREEEGFLNWEERERLEAFAAALDARFSQRFLGTLGEAKVGNS